MLKKVAVILFTERTPASQPCDGLLLELTKSGRPSFVLPATACEPGEMPTQAVARLAASLGCQIPSAAWSLLGIFRDESTVVFTASVSAKSLQGSRQPERFRVDSAQMWLCDAWVNPVHYEADFLQLLALAHAEHQSN